MSYDETEHAHLVYECQPFTVVCVKCKQATETGSQMSLEIEGWQLTDLGEVCGKCTKRIVRESLQHSRDVISLVNRLQHPPAFVPFEGYGVK